VAVREIFVTEDTSSLGVIDAARGRAIPVTEVSDHVMATLSDTSTPQGLIAVVERTVAPLESLRTADLVLVLAGVADPGNAGALIRSALAAGVSGVVVTAGSVDPFGPKTVRASAGALFRMPVVCGPAAPETLAELSNLGLTVIVAEAGAAPVDEADLTRRVAIVVGNEARGLDPEARGAADELVGVAMPGPVESLNVSIAGSIVLFETVRQRRAAARVDQTPAASPRLSSPDRSDDEPERRRGAP